jgi:hypothetical protein
MKGKSVAHGSKKEREKERKLNSYIIFAEDLCALSAQ